MARTTKNTKKPPAPTTPALEATKEAHLDPGQFADMDDANLQQLARDMGLDPAAYADREALIAAIAAVPVIPGPPEGQEATSAPQEGQEATSAPQEGQEQPQEQPQEQSDAQQGQDTTQVQEGQQDAPEGQEEGQGNQGTPEPVPITERPLPFRATVAAPVAVLRRAVIGTAEMVKPVATLDGGTAVTVVAFEGNSARLANGLYIKTNLLTR